MCQLAATVLETTVLVGTGSLAGWLVLPIAVRAFGPASAVLPDLARRLGFWLVFGLVLVVACIRLEDMLRGCGTWVGAVDELKSGLWGGAVARLAVLWGRFLEAHERRLVRIRVTVRRGDNGDGIPGCRVTVLAGVPSLWTHIGRVSSDRVGQCARRQPDRPAGFTGRDGSFTYEGYVWVRRRSASGEGQGLRLAARFDADGFGTKTIEQRSGPNDCNKECIAVDFGAVDLLVDAL